MGFFVFVVMKDEDEKVDPNKVRYVVWRLWGEGSSHLANSLLSGADARPPPGMSGTVVEAEAAMAAAEAKKNDQERPRHRGSWRA